MFSLNMPQLLTSSLCMSNRRLRFFHLESSANPTLDDVNDLIGKDLLDEGRHGREALVGLELVEDEHDARVGFDVVLYCLEKGRLRPRLG